MHHRIFVDTIEPSTIVTGDEFHHSVRVVRLRVGEDVELFDRAGNAARGVVAAIDKDRAVITTGETLPSRESSIAIHLAVAIIQLEKFELVLQKATELGVRSIIPLVTERVELRPERYSGKAERWERIVFEAVKQSGRTRIPLVELPARLNDILRRPGTKILFDADAEPDVAQTDVAQTLLSVHIPEVTLLIGPEGGWTSAELEAARESGVLFQTLGPRRLRAETAAIAAVTVTGSRFGDL